MAIILVGLSYHTATIELREQVYLDNDVLCSALAGLQHLHHRAHAQLNALHEVAILSTCNRLEVYGVCDDVEETAELITGFLSQLTNVPHPDLSPVLYVKRDETAIEQLLRVTCGLDSVVLGEAQILGQVKDAHLKALELHTMGPILDRLFSIASHLGKRARTETDIGDYAVSVSHAAVDLVRHRLGDLSDKHVLVLGTGQMGLLAARSLKGYNVGQMSFINRTYQRAAMIADEIGGNAYGWAHIHEVLPLADIVISATGAPHTILHVDDYEVICKYQTRHDQIIVDLAVPRDIEPSVGDLPCIALFNVDDLQAVVSSNLEQRRASIPHVEILIQQTLYEFKTWLASRAVVPMLSSLRQKVNQVATQEIEDAMRRLQHMDTQDREVVQRLVHRIVNKVLHTPTTRLKAVATSEAVEDYIRVLADLFALDDQQDQEQHV